MGPFYRLRDVLLGAASLLILGFCIVAVLRSVQHERRCADKAAAALKTEVGSGLDEAHEVVVGQCDYTGVGSTTQYVCEVSIDGEKRLVGALFTCR